MKKFSKIVLAGVSLIPSLVLAESVDLTYVTTGIASAGTILNILVQFLVALAVVWFIVNVIRYTIANDEEKKKESNYIYRILITLHLLQNQPQNQLD